MNDIGSRRTRGAAILAAAIVLVWGMPATAAVEHGASIQGGPLEPFRTLAGEWQGTNSTGESVRLVYDVLGGGSAVMERLTMPTTQDHSPHDMVTLYYMDGDRLLLTHYCVAGNQPRMRLVSHDGGKARFDFLDATGLAGPEAGHMHRAVLSFEGPDRLTSSWTWFEGGKESFTEVIRVTRTAAQAAR